MAKKVMAAKKATEEKAPETKATETKATETKATAKKAAVKKAAPPKAPPATSTEEAPTSPPSPAQPTPAPPATSLRVREDESPWTVDELFEVRSELDRDVGRLTADISTAETGLHELLRDSGDGTGDDQADAGAKTFEREQEISLANNSREMLEQSQRALAAITDGTYGICESCGLPVGKMRLQAFPRATLCVSCKSRQERR